MSDQAKKVARRKLGELLGEPPAKKGGGSTPDLFPASQLATLNDPMPPQLTPQGEEGLPMQVQVPLEIGDEEAAAEAVRKFKKPAPGPTLQWKAVFECNGGTSYIPFMCGRPWYEIWRDQKQYFHHTKDKLLKLVMTGQAYDHNTCDYYPYCEPQEFTEEDYKRWLASQAKSS